MHRADAFDPSAIARMVAAPNADAAGHPLNLSSKSPAKCDTAIVSSSTHLSSGSPLSATNSSMLGAHPALETAALSPCSSSAGTPLNTATTG